MKAVIMAGGHGTRLWPLSTKERPKQFQKILGEKTLLQAAYERLKFVKDEDIFVSTNQDFAHLVIEQLPNLPKANIIIEPLRRDTGPAMAFVTHHLAQLGFSNDVISIIYADQYIKDTAALQSKLALAFQLAQSTKKIIMIPIKAKEPNINLGYIKLGAMIDQQNDHNIYELDQFIEKPDLKTATSYANSNNYLWNTGLYTWHIASFLEMLKKHTPEIYKVLETITNTANCEAQYENFPKISIDYALMEKLAKNEVLVIPADFEWSDVGNWQTVHEHLQDENTNVLNGEVHTIDTENSIIYTNGEQRIVTIGIKDLAIICTKDTILICPKSETNRLKQMVEKLDQ
ncbi:hypothetical protein COV81_04410 [Candidatus Peregrinibacteria bacterium CG11_big_fil_rev_8_21_14_0_20_41_10]|nr:MAG: hypothetical protein COV81_04410 [Candidatus Peregrinibacteria bacterium CG11_big_fil_rev_8_21_14_0_20_41_10]PIZ74524.1 MAG: hypothetical protein COY06_04155 [Candidatus Peregrinibacteria bacterium CG_4_10_14_0_2_um_filter_41_8]PJC38219.1 MAG: hypothetical protein CO045_01385 [Candidatus Peregrinibacteria bacterium CG_4_9_14_0_2_um_filter_41_14]